MRELTPEDLRRAIAVLNVGIKYLTWCRGHRNVKLASDFEKVRKQLYVWLDKFSKIDEIECPLFKMSVFEVDCHNCPACPSCRIGQLKVKALGKRK